MLSNSKIVIVFVPFHTVIIIIQGSPHSVFPSLFGNENDILLLSMSGDDAWDEAQFQAPLGTETLGHVKGEDDVSATSFHATQSICECY